MTGDPVEGRGRNGEGVEPKELLEPEEGDAGVPPEKGLEDEEGGGVPKRELPEELEPVPGEGVVVDVALPLMPEPPNPKPLLAPPVGREPPLLPKPPELDPEGPLLELEPPLNESCALSSGHSAAWQKTRATIQRQRHFMRTKSVGKGGWTVAGDDKPGPALGRCAFQVQRGEFNGRYGERT